jgi:hypothetical protein
LLFLKDEKRIQRVVQENDNSDFSEDEHGHIVRRKRVAKKYKKRTIKQINKELLDDPMLMPTKKLAKIENEAIQGAIEVFVDDQDFRFNQDDFHDKSTDTSDEIQFKDGHSMTWIDDVALECSGESFIKPMPKAPPLLIPPRPIPYEIKPL